MKHAILGAALLAITVLGQPGCAYRYKFVREEAPSKAKTVKEWRHIGLWGWTKPAPFDLKKACPGGVAEFGSYVSFPNWVFAFVTLGLYSPRTVYAVPVERPFASR
jgi:hypothetical protein